MLGAAFSRSFVQDRVLKPIDCALESGPLSENGGGHWLAEGRAKSIFIRDPWRTPEVTASEN